MSTQQPVVADVRRRTPIITQRFRLLTSAAKKPAWFICAMLTCAQFAVLAATPNTNRYAWGSSPYIPVNVTVNENAVVLSAGGERVELKGQLFKVDAKAEVAAEWKKEVRDFTIFSLQLKAEQPTRVESVHWFAGKWNGVDETAVQRTHLVDNVLFLRKGNVSFFISLDFPYSKITENSVSYPAAKSLAAGEAYTAHSITVGACKLSGIRVGKFDRAEIEAVSSYVEQRFPPRFERPMFVSAGIVNRMTYAHERREGELFMGENYRMNELQGGGGAGTNQTGEEVSRRLSRGVRGDNKSIEVAGWRNSLTCV